MIRDAFTIDISFSPPFCVAGTPSLSREEACSPIFFDAARTSFAASFAAITPRASLRVFSHQLFSIAGVLRLIFAAVSIAPHVRAVIACIGRHPSTAKPSWLPTDGYIESLKTKKHLGTFALLLLALSLLAALLLHCASARPIWSVELERAGAIPNRCKTKRARSRSATPHTEVMSDFGGATAFAFFGARTAFILASFAFGPGSGARGFLISAPMHRKRAESFVYGGRRSFFTLVKGSDLSAYKYSMPLALYPQRRKPMTSAASYDAFHHFAGDLLIRGGSAAARISMGPLGGGSCAFKII